MALTRAVPVSTACYPQIQIRSSKQIRMVLASHHLEKCGSNKIFGQMAMKEMGASNRG